MTHRELVARFGSAARAFDSSGTDAERQAALHRADRLLERAGEVGLALVAREEDAYPARLLELPDAPPLLWTAGDRATLRDPVVAIVGTRRATAYGLRVTRELAAGLARAGACIVSGMAAGIDAEAHLAALDAGGRTVAVLGTGADVAYPTAHRALHGRIAAQGLVLSEQPPGARAAPGVFPRRNRLVAALADVVIVVEAGVKSGALITAALGLELGRTVAAVPGPIDAPESTGSNELLRDGAVVLASLADALALVNLTPALRAPRDLPPDEHAVWHALAAGPCDLDVLTSRSALPAARCLAAVTRLELDGAIECALTGEIRRR